MTAPGPTAPEAPAAGVAAVVLAAGGGSRFAGDVHKLLQPLWGRPIVAWAVRAALCAGLAEVAVVEGAVDLAPVLPGWAVVLHNPDWAAGQAGSLRLGLDWCERRGHRAAVVGLGDQPLVSSDAWRAVAACEAAPIVVATYAGRRRNPVRLDRSVWPLLPTVGDEGARVLMAARPDLVAEVACTGAPLDVDTLEDLAGLEAVGPSALLGPPPG